MHHLKTPQSTNICVYIYIFIYFSVSMLAHETHGLSVTHRSCTPSPQQMADFHSILDVPQLWKCLGALWPGEVGQLKWRARCLLVNPRALRGQRRVLYQLQSQEEVDECYYYDDHSSCASLLCSSGSSHVIAVIL